MQSILGHRTKQLRAQAQVDEDLKTLIPTCPDIVAEYLLWRREVNRVQYVSTLSSGIMHAYGHINENMKEEDKHQQEVKRLFREKEDHPRLACERLKHTTFGW